MEKLLAAYPTIVAYIGVIDTIFVLLVGLIAAVLWLFDYKAEAFWNRVIPSCFILVGTSVAAGIIMWVTRVVVGHIS